MQFYASSLSLQWPQFVFRSGCMCGCILRRGPRLLECKSQVRCEEAVSAVMLPVFYQAICGL